MSHRLGARWMIKWTMELFQLIYLIVTQQHVQRWSFVSCVSLACSQVQFFCIMVCYGSQSYSFSILVNQVLSNTIKQKRKEKAGKWDVPLPKVSLFITSNLCPSLFFLPNMLPSCVNDECVNILHRQPLHSFYLHDFENDVVSLFACVHQIFFYSSISSFMFSLCYRLGLLLKKKCFGLFDLAKGKVSIWHSCCLIQFGNKLQIEVLWILYQCGIVLMSSLIMLGVNLKFI